MNHLGTTTSFEVPFLHRLRFTDDVLGEQQEILADVLEPSAGQPARVQFWLDENVALAHPRLRHRLRSFAAARGPKMILVGNVQDDFQSALVRGLKNDAWSHVVLVSLLPTRGAETPAVTGFETRETIFGDGG